MPNHYAFELMSPVIKKKIGDFFASHRRGVDTGKLTAYDSTKNEHLSKLEALNQVQDVDIWIEEVEKLLRKSENYVEGITTARDETSKIFLRVDPLIFKTFSQLAKEKSLDEINAGIDNCLKKTALSDRVSGALINTIGSQFAGAAGFARLESFFQFLGVTIAGNFKNMPVVSCDVLPKVIALLGGTDPNHAKQQIVLKIPNYLTSLQKEHSAQVSEEKTSVDLACLFLHKTLSQYFPNFKEIPKYLIAQLKSSPSDNRKKVLARYREILARQPLGVARLLALPYVGDDFAGVSRTLGAHFGQMCQGELFIQLEEEGLKFYCVEGDAQDLMTCFQEAGLIVYRQVKEGGPDSKEQPNFKNNAHVLCFPHTEIETLLELAQYNPGNIRSVLDALYRTKNMPRLECLTKAAIANITSPSPLTIPSNTPLDIALTTSQHPTHPDKMVVKVDFTAPILKPSPDSPQRLILILDDSGSMAGERIACLNQAVRTLVEELKHKAPDTLLTVLTLNGGQLLKNVAISKLSEDEKRKITTIKANGDTLLLEATIASIDTLRQTDWNAIPAEIQDATTMILLTDGDTDRTSDNFCKAMATSLRSNKGRIEFENKVVQGFGTEKFPNHRPFVLIPIGVGEDYNKELLQSLGQKVGYGFYDVPNPADTTKAVTAASRACLPKTSGFVFGMGTKEKTAAKLFKPLLSGQSVSHCFTLDSSASKEDINHVLFYNKTTVISPLQLPEQTSLRYDYTVIADYVLQEHDRIMVEKLEGALKGSSQISRGGRSFFVPGNPPPPPPPPRTELIEELYALLNQLGDMPHPLLDHVRKEIYASIDQLHAENPNLHGRLSMIGRRTNGFEPRFQAAATREKVVQRRNHNPLISVWHKNSKNEKVEGVRTEINHRLSAYFGCDVILTADTKDFSVTLAFRNEKIAENFSQCIGTEKKQQSSDDNYFITLPPERVVELFDAIAVHESGSTLVQQRNLLQRFVGIGIEEALGNTNQGWPSGLRFEAGHPWFIDGTGMLRQGVLELQQAFIDAGHSQKGLTGTLATLLGVVIERATVATQAAYQKAIPSVVQFTNPTWNVHHQGYQFDVERVGNVNIPISQNEKQMLILWLQTRLREHGLEELVEPRYFTKSEVNKCILKCKPNLTGEQKLAISAILSKLMNPNGLARWSDLKVDLGKPRAISPKNQSLSDFPELEDLLTDPISLEPFEKPVITPSGQTYSYESIKNWLTSHANDPMTKQPLSLNQLRPNPAVSELLEGFETNGVDITKNPVSKAQCKIDNIDNVIVKAISEFFTPSIKNNIPFIDHPNPYTVIAVAAAMLVPGEGCLDIEDARSGLRVPTMVLNFDGSLTFTFDSVEYTQRLFRALTTRNLSASSNQNDLTIDAQSVDIFLVDFLNLSPQSLQEKMKAAGIVTNTDGLADSGMSNSEKQKNLQTRSEITQTRSYGLNKLSRALQGERVQWGPYASTGTVQCALQNFVALHTKGLSEHEKGALQRVSQLLMDDEAQFISGLKRDENIVKFALEQCGKNEDLTFLEFAEEDAEDLLKGAEKRRIINMATPAPGELGSKVDHFLRSTDVDNSYQLPPFLPQGDQKTVDELILTGGGRKEHRAIIRIVKVGVDEEGNRVKLGAKPFDYSYFCLEFNAGAGAPPAKGSPNQVWSVMAHKILPKENKPIEQTLKDLIVAQRMLLRYRSLDEITKGKQYYSAADIEEAEQWVYWSKQAQNCLGDEVVPDLCQKGPAQMDDSCELTSLQLFLNYYLPPELSKRFWQFARTMNADLTKAALDAQMEGKNISVNMISKTLAQPPSRFAPDAMAPLKLGYTAVAVQGDEGDTWAATVDLDEQLQNLRNKIAQPPVDEENPVDEDEDEENSVDEDEENSDTPSADNEIKVETATDPQAEISLPQGPPPPYVPNMVVESIEPAKPQAETPLRQSPPPKMSKVVIELSKSTKPQAEIPLQQKLPANLPNINKDQQKTLAHLQGRAVLFKFLTIPTALIVAAIGGGIGFIVGGPVGAAIGACVGGVIGASISAVPAFYYQRQLNSASIIQREDVSENTWRNDPLNGITVVTSNETTEPRIENIISRNSTPGEQQPQSNLIKIPSLKH